MHDILARCGEALFLAFGMAWEVGWSLVLGFAISGLLQALVSTERIRAALGRDGVREYALAAAAGAASSSCSYAAASVMRRLFKGGAAFGPSLAFLFASTNLVAELGIVLWLLMGWQFTAAEWVGGVVLIAILATLLRLTYPARLVEAARAHPEPGQGHVHGQPAARGSAWQRLGSRDTWVVVARSFAMDWSMLWKDLLGGFLIAGALAAFVPDGVWQALFVSGASPWVRVPANALLGPLVAVLSFVCSIGNVPMAAVLWGSGVSFGGVLAFLYADLLVIPLLDVYRRYFGWRMAAYMAALFYATMVVSALLMDVLFSAAGWVPHARPGGPAAMVHLSFNYTFWLNLLFGAAATALFWIARRAPRAAARRASTTPNRTIRPRPPIAIRVGARQEENQTEETMTNRRDVLAGLAIGAGGMLATAAQADIQPSRAPGRGGSDPGPHDLAREQQNPDILNPPSTDHGTLPNLRFSFADAHVRQESGGWTRQVTERELGVSKSIAGVNMRLNRGGVRELHWHKEAEWAFMLYGSARITAIDPQGRNFVDDVGVGDLWYFPSGIPHSIQGLDPDGCEFLLVFDSGGFDEDSTFLLSDWFRHVPNEVLAKNFGVPGELLSHTPDPSQLYIFPAPVPGPLGPDKLVGATPVPLSFSHRMMAQDPIRTKSGTVRITDSSIFKASRTIAGALVELEPGGLRELHWHPNTDEWQYYIEGEGRMGVFASSGQARTFDFRGGDVGYVPFAMGHYVENTGDKPLRFLEMFKSSTYADLSLNQWLALTPPELVAAHLHLDKQVMEALRKQKDPVVPV